MKPSRTAGRNSPSGTPRARAKALAAAIAALPRPLMDDVAPPRDPILAVSAHRTLARIIGQDALPRLLAGVERDPSLGHGIARIRAHLELLDRKIATLNDRTRAENDPTRAGHVNPSAYEALLDAQVALADVAASVVVALASAPSAYQPVADGDLR